MFFHVFMTYIHAESKVCFGCWPLPFLPGIPKPGTLAATADLQGELALGSFQLKLL